MTEREKLFESCKDLTVNEVKEVLAFANNLIINRPIEIITTVYTETNWAAIKRAAEKGNLKSGDKIPVTLKNSEAVTLIIGHDKKGKAYFCFDDALNDTYAMNDTNTNSGGWAATKMRDRCNNTLLYLLPDTLQAIIEPTEIVQIVNGERVTTHDKLFLLSMTQYFGTGDWNKIEPEDSQLDIYTTERSRVKECGKHGTWPHFTRTPSTCFERSAYYGGSDGFCCVYYSGSADYYSAGYSRGAAPAFCITKS